MFDHSVKVPRLYKTAAKIAREVSAGKGSIKQLVYEGKHPNIKALYALVVHTFQRTDDIEKLFNKSKLLVKEPRFDPWLAKVLVTELLWGKKRLASQAKPVMTILAYEQIFKAHLSDVSSNDFEEVQQVDKPRYVRINTLKTTPNEAIEDFQNEGWVLKRYTGSDYLEFLESVRNLGQEEFMIDFHIPYLLIFPPKTQFYKHQAYKNGNIILQDKASCLPGYILNPEPGSTVLDMCAAPGMKTTHCAAIIQDTGKIHAVEIGKKRYETLKKIIDSSGATCINAINEDVLKILGKDYPDVEYILVDPSCSGSGITDRVEIGQQEMDQNKNRLDKLAGFQIKILRHALTKFHKAKRVVYSTCSVYPEENEDVVRQVLETCFYFKLVSADKFVKHQWSNFGCSEFGDIGNYCLYARPDIDLTSGFFVAVFERLEEGEKNQFLNERLFSQKMLTWWQNKRKEELGDLVGDESEKKDQDKGGINEEDAISTGEEAPKKKKNKCDEATTIVSNEEVTEDVPIAGVKIEDLGQKKRKKDQDQTTGRGEKVKKKKKTDLTLIKTENYEEDATLTEDVVPKKKKKRTDETTTIKSNEEITEEAPIREVKREDSNQKKRKKSQEKTSDDGEKTEKKIKTDLAWIKTENLEEDATQIEEVARKKKKKKDNGTSSKREVTEEVLIKKEIEELVENVDNSVGEKKRRNWQDEEKTKKSKKTDLTFIKVEEDAAPSGEVASKKKKKNQFDGISSKEEIITSNEEVAIKKKKKKSATENGADASDEVHKKKKKVKSSDLDEVSNFDQADIGEVKTKKKEKKIEKKYSGETVVINEEKNKKKTKEGQEL